MIKEKFCKSNYYKIVVSILVFVILLLLWRNGYEFGKWLHALLNRS